MNRFKIVLMASLLVQGVACLEAKADNTPEGNKTNSNSKALGVNAVSGKVTNEQGEALPGVVVRCGNTNVQTDLNGEFHVNVNDGDKLTFTYIGYNTITKDTDDNNLKVVMKENTQALGEVIVTTQKKKQSSLEIPVAVSAVTGSVMEKLNLHQMDDVAQFTPGVQIQLQSPNNPGYVIRGVTSDGGEAYSQPRVSVFMDGVSTSRSRSSAVELFDLERLEVVKGPQGTLFGRGAEIGGINIIRHKPVNEQKGELSLNYGSYNQRQVTGFINTPIIKDKLANRFAFDYDARDGFIKNEAGGRLNGKNALAFRNSTQWWANDDTSVGVVLDYQHDDYPALPSIASTQPLAIATQTVLQTWKPASSWASSETWVAPCSISTTTSATAGRLIPSPDSEPSTAMSFSMQMVLISHSCSARKKRRELSLARNSDSIMMTKSSSLASWEPAISTRIHHRMSTPRRISSTSILCLSRRV